MLRFPAIVAAALVCQLAVLAGQWTHFRGEGSRGHAEGGKYPVSWSETNGIAWQTPVHGRAWSSPVVLGNQVWMTTATEDGQELFAIALDFQSGKVIRDQKLFQVDAPQFAHKFNTYGSPSPAIEPGRVYISFGSPGIACLDTATGKVLWERRDFVCNHFRGAGSSPVIYKDLLLLHFDGSDNQFVTALDKQTGTTVWKQNRSIDYKDIGADGKPEADGDWRKAFSTPVIHNFGAGDVMLSLGSKAIYGYEPSSGKELWRVEERKCHSGSASPVVCGELIFMPMGFSKGELIAVNQKNAVSSPESAIAWRSSRNVPNKPSAICVDGLLYLVDEAGVVSCLEPANGAEVWRERIGGNYSASPIFAGGHIYFFSEEGKATVIKPGRVFEVVAKNDLGDGYMATPAAVDGKLILRSRTKVYCIQ